MEKSSGGNLTFDRGMALGLLAGLSAAAVSPEFVESVAHPFLQHYAATEIDTALHLLIDGGKRCYEDIQTCTAVRLNVAFTLAAIEGVTVGAVLGICLETAGRIKKLFARGH